jgi:hypothetical protein
MLESRLNLKYTRENHSITLYPQILEDERVHFSVFLKYLSTNNTESVPSLQ